MSGRYGRGQNGPSDVVVMALHGFGPSHGGSSVDFTDVQTTSSKRAALARGRRCSPSPDLLRLLTWKASRLGKSSKIGTVQAQIANTPPVTLGVHVPQDHAGR